jgi:hypothetical protein
MKSFSTECDFPQFAICWRNFCPLSPRFGNQENGAGCGNVSQMEHSNAGIDAGNVTFINRF